MKVDKNLNLIPIDDLDTDEDIDDDEDEEDNPFENDEIDEIAKVIEDLSNSLLMFANHRGGGKKMQVTCINL